MSDQRYLDEIREVWGMVKDSFRETLSESTISWLFEDIKILAFENDTITMGTASEFKFKIINEKHAEDIAHKFSSLFGFDVRINMTFTGSAVAASQFAKQEDAPKKAPVSDTLNYHFEYTFENFIVGSTNKFAHAACVSVANHPATNYNPLFIYGNSGLGKTHLLHATINQMKKNNPGVKIIYTKCEDFTNQMVACLADKSMDDFKEKYRKCDVLLIDDIQFIAGKMATQEEFFHTFNALYEEKKQIILTSDRPPRDINNLEDRLKSRFEWGLLADIEPPDLELRIAIIKNKAEQVGVFIPDDVLTFLGENLRSNIRQLEGAIKKLGALSFLSGKDINMNLARECISELLGGAEPVNITVDKIFGAVFRKYGISKEDLVGPKRNKEIAHARHMAIYLIRDVIDMSFPNIAKIFNRDNATIMASNSKAAMMVQSDPLCEMDFQEMKKEVLGH